jgi:hypothetical protein
MSLRVACDAHHFASSVETVKFSVLPPKGKKIKDVRMLVTDRSGTEVYKKWWLSGNVPADRKFPWDGECNLLPEVEYPDKTKGHPYAHPLASCYKATFHAKLEAEAAPDQAPEGVSTSSDTGVQQCPRRRSPYPPDDGYEWQSGSALVWVLYREIKFEPITWLDVYKAVTELGDGAFPDSGTENQKLAWLAYKLNELGYMAGPLEWPPNQNAIRRALFRYTRAHPELGQIYEFDTLDAGAPGSCGWGWRAKWEALFGTLADMCRGTAPDAGEDLLARLQGDEKKRSDVIETSDALSDRGKSSRVIIDHDIYYLNREWDKPDAHADYDKEFLNRFAQPFKAVIRLVSKSDSNATKPGVDAPKAVGPIALDWLVFDPPEDVSILPQPVQTDSSGKSQTAGFIDQTRKKLAAAYDDKANFLDNCPENLGGFRPSDPSDMSGFFANIWNQEVFGGRSVVQYVGSYVGGDNHVVQARLSLDGVIKDDHQKLSGLAKSFGEVKCLGADDADDPMVAQSGPLTVWRRHHVLREVVWGATQYQPIAWAPVVEHFKVAHVILVPPAQAPIHAKDLLDAPTQDRMARTIASDQTVIKEANKEFTTRAREVKFNKDCLYPLPLPDYNRMVTVYGKAEMEGDDDIDRFERYSGFLTRDLGQWPKFDDVRPLALELRRAMDGMQAGPGVIILRVDYFPKADFPALLPPKMLKATKAQQAAFSMDRGICAGIDHGVVMLDRNNSAKYEEAYLVAHEIAHCVFATHPFAANTVGDHDRTDKNCLMNYNVVGVGNGLINEAWGMKSVPESYELSVTLKGQTRGDALGAMSSPFAVRVERTNRKTGETAYDMKVFDFKGTLKECQKALGKAKFTPAKGLDGDYKISLTLDAKIRPKLSTGERWPIVVEQPVSKGSYKPFTNVTIQDASVTDHKPAFCGKCVLKLRGWKVFQPGGVVAPDAVPEKSIAIPVKPRMAFIEYKYKKGRYLAQAPVNDFVSLEIGAKDPQDKKVELGPYQFLHIHRLTWESSNGDLLFLTGIKTRERITFRAPTQQAPFCDFADPDQDFAQVGDDAQKGCSFDDHSVRWPALICATPLSTGTLIGEQWYQYSFDGIQWQNIEEAAFLLEKSVFNNGKHWVLKFRKSNWLPHNPNTFNFEIQYKIFPAPVSRPAIGNNPKAAPPTQQGSNWTIFQAGAREGQTVGDGNPIPISLSELKKKGYVIG